MLRKPPGYYGSFGGLSGADLMIAHNNLIGFKIDLATRHATHRLNQAMIIGSRE